MDSSNDLLDITSLRKVENLSPTCEYIDLGPKHASSLTKFHQSPVYFYFDIINGAISNIKTNSENHHLIEKNNYSDIKFNTSAFVNIQIKLLTTSSTTGLLFRFPDLMLDSQNGPCINLNWIGCVNNGDKFMLSGPIDVHTNGYWYISIL